MAREFKVGMLVMVAGRGPGMLEMDNEDGTWSVGFDDNTDGDFSIEEITIQADPLEQIALAGGARVVPQDLWRQEKPAGWTRFVVFSDTHGLHNQISPAHYVEADVLLHAGDLTNTGELENMQSLSEWLKRYPAKHKVVIAGNHDVTMHPTYYERSWQRFHPQPYDCDAVRRALLDSGCCIYLEDEMTEVMGYRIYGSPWQPEFCDWAFQLQEGDALKEIWEKIPTEVDVLMVHGPAFGFCDTTSTGKQAGCKDLLRAIEARNVAVFVAGHIHNAYGVKADGTTVYVNASTCDHKYKAIHAPIVFDLPPPEELRRVVHSMKDNCNA